MAKTQHSNTVYPLNIIRRRYQNNNFTLVEDDQNEMIQWVIGTFEHEIKRNNHLYCGWNFNVFYKFIDEYWIYDEDIDIEDICENITNIIEIRSNIVLEKRRPKNVKFAVGMIITYNRLGYCNTDGVIIGWHHQCDKKFLNKLKETVMCPYLRFHVFYDICECYKRTSDNQLHYIILANDNRICYIREDQLRFSKKNKKY
ncbi:uncharacterized protein LOC126855612 [Cataglyphis hispanica]|uniref:uncharacterized protein LOC126855612 n=1 Tax=Cataglyphis hispanica TaxID=1086592 RepID=UPI002180921B|nr:uncharacterized protein LOC126855612 [Cataglyphis hispanica]